MIDLTQDICPISDFRANAMSMISRARENRHPIVLTQHGKSAAVVLGVEDYQEMLETIEYLKANDEAEQSINSGKGLNHSEAKKAILARIA